MLRYRRQIEDAGEVVLFNGEQITSYVFAFPGDSAGYIVCQEFPPGWFVGDPMPEERVIPGRVSIVKPEPPAEEAGVRLSPCGGARGADNHAS